MANVSLTKDEALSRAIHRHDMVACKVAFIDCKLPGSDLKENYSMIGAGVTQSADQIVNLTEPHGFSVGAAAMPAGVTNNLHLHFTPEVFFIYSGTWRFRWGSGEGAGEIEGRTGDIMSVPTWIFRGFSNVGDDTGWIFTALGGDDTGGIIWHPDILARAEQYDLYLGRDNALIQSQAGVRPAADTLMTPLAESDMSALRRYSVHEMQSRIVRASDRHWSPTALLGNCVSERGGCELAPVIGHGMTEDRNQVAPISDSHGFSVDWLRLESGAKTGRFLLREKQVLIVMEGAVSLIVGTADGDVRIVLLPQGMYSVPPGVWRDIEQYGSTAALVALVTTGDQRKRIVWAPGVLAQAEERDLALDPAGYIAPLHCLPQTARGVGVVQ